MDNLRITQVHIDTCGTCFTDSPEIVALRESTGLDLFSTRINVYYNSKEYGLPDWRYLNNFQAAPHEHYCKVGDKLREWLHDYESAWTETLFPEPVELELIDGVLDVKGEYNPICDLKLVCDADESSIIDCGCYECVHGDWDREIEKIKAVSEWTNLKNC